MPRTVAGVIGMYLGCQLWKTGCEDGAMASLTAFLTGEHVCVASRSTALSSSTSSIPTNLLFQAPCLVAVAAMFTHGTSDDSSTSRHTELLFANQSKCITTTASGIACWDNRPQHCGFVCHSPLSRHLVIDFWVSIGHLPV